MTQAIAPQYRPEIPTPQLGVLSAHIIDLRTGERLFPQGTLLTKNLVRELKDRGIPAEAIGSKATGGLDYFTIATSVDEARYAIEDLLQGAETEHIKAIQGTVHESANAEIKKLSETLQINLNEYKTHVSKIVKAMGSHNHIGGLLAADHLRTKSEITTLEHNTEAMIFATMFAQHVRRTRIQINGTNITEDLVIETGLAAYFHDAGKIFTPDEILNFQGRLSQKQREIMEAHVLHGYYLLTQNQYTDTFAGRVALSHHESPDGQKGYGATTYANHIKASITFTPEESIGKNMVKITEIYSALTQKRPYHGIRCKADALMIMNQMYKEKYLGKEEYESFYAMVRENFPVPLFTKGSHIHIDPRDLSSPFYQNLGLEAGGNHEYMLFVHYHSDTMQAYCTVLDLKKEGDLEHQAIPKLRHKLIDFTEKLKLPAMNLGLKLPDDDLLDY